MEANDVDRLDWRLLPSEHVLWHGRPVPGLLSDHRWTLGAVFLVTLATISWAFSGLLWVSEIEGSARLAACGLLLVGLAACVRIAPRYLHDRCAYVLTDRRIIWRRGVFRRTMDRNAVDYARIRWQRDRPGIGHLELVRAVPFGPLARQQRLQLLNVRAPDRVWAILRGVPPASVPGAGDVALVDRLDPDERVVWGGHPEGWLMGWREIGIASIGVAVLLVGIRYGSNVGGILISLEELGLAVNSWTWLFFLIGMAVTFALLISIGGALLWFGLWRTRQLGHDTEYLVTDKRLLIRRGRVELSLDLGCIVDVAEAPSKGGLHHAFLVLDAPGSRALSVSGALGVFLPARDSVAPVLYELRDVTAFRTAILGRRGEGDRLAMSDAA